MKIKVGSETVKTRTDLQLRFDFDHAGKITPHPASVTSGQACDPSNPHGRETCPGCGEELVRRRACYECNRCGFNTCGSD